MGNDKVGRGLNHIARLTVKIRPLLFPSAIGLLAWWIFFSIWSPIHYFQLAVVNRLTDQATLGRVATTHGNDNDVRLAAVAKLTDQASLLEVATNDYSVNVLAAATRGLTDQAYLARVATTNTDQTARGIAVEKLTDQSALAHVALNDSYWLNRSDATRKLTDQAVLARVACTDVEWLTRREAVERLTDQAVLAQVAVGDKDFSIRLGAVARLRPEGLAVAAREANDVQQREFILALALFFDAAHACTTRDGPNHLLAKLIPLANRYAKTESIAKKGSLRKVVIRVQPVSQGYMSGPTIKGENISLFLTFSAIGLAKPVVWYSRFSSQEELHKDWSETDIQLDEAP